MKPFYFPIERGVYEIGPGLRPIGFNFENGFWDHQIFQVFSDPCYLENKLVCFNERLEKYLQKEKLDRSVEISWFKKIVYLLNEASLVNPAMLHWNLRTDKGQTTIEIPVCPATMNQSIRFSVSLQDLSVFNLQTDLVIPKVNQLNGLDLLLLFVPEDVAILQKSQRGDQALNWISYLHLCSPSHWAAEDKIGMDFNAIHAPVPGIEKMLKASGNIVDAMIHKGPYSRFIWSFVTDTRLNHHPMHPEGFDEIQWKGRSFNETAEEPFYLRIERQTTSGDPETQSSLFTIGITFIKATEIKSTLKYRENLLGALLSMTPESRKYKGVDQCFDLLVQYLK